MRAFLTALVCGLAISIPCQAGFFGIGIRIRKEAAPCSHCGGSQLKKVCRLVSDVKKLTETKYSVEEEEICLPGKSANEERVFEDSCAPGGRRCETVQVPRCGEMYCKKKLKKTTTTVEKPIQKCVVETVCCQCGSICERGHCGQ